MFFDLYTCTNIYFCLLIRSINYLGIGILSNMSRKSKRSQAASLSQKSNLSQSQRSNLTQSTLEETFGDLNLDIDDQTNNLVRYIINRAGNHFTFKQSEFKKNVLIKSGVKYQEVVEKAMSILKNVYGYNMIVIDPSSSTREYIVSNSLQYIEHSETIENEEYPEDTHKVLLLLILSHILMSNGTVGEVSLHAFLKSLKIDVERRHDLFGNVKDYIYHNLKNKKYLKIEIDQISKKASLSWGPRSEKEISKHEVLQFICKMYNDRLPNSWTSQFKIAEQQNYGNHRDVSE